MNVVSITKEKIILCSGMSEEAFGKTNYASIITQSGLFYNGKDLSKWSFKDVIAQAEENSDIRQVCYAGDSPFSGNPKTLLSYFKDAASESATINEKDSMYKAGLAVCSFLTFAAKEKIDLPKIGAGGILVNLENETPEILFLPQNLFEGSVAGLSKVEYADQNGCWINTTIFDLPSICFERAVIAYKMLTGRYPFPNADLEERNADILDKKFLPIDLCINGINEQLAVEINKALQLNANIVSVPGKKQKGKASEDLTPTPDFPLDLLESAPKDLGNSKLSDEEFAKKAEQYLKSQTSKVNTKRAIRRNTTKIGAILIGVLVVGISASNYLRTNRGNPTSMGLTSTQTIETLYQGVNSKDTALVDCITKGRNPKNLVSTVSRIYVIGKQRQAYGNDNGFASPENWIVFIKDQSFLDRTGLFGITNLKIDGKLSNLDVEIHEKKDRIPALKEEKGITLTKGAESVHSVEYYLLHSEGDSNELFIEYVTGTVTLNYIKNRWIITDLETESETLPVDSSRFYYEYFKLLKTNEGNIETTVRQMSFENPWLPQLNLVKKEIKKQEDLIKDPFMIF